MFGLAIDAEINNESVFEEENYFYPDLPKGYQTTQLENQSWRKGSVPITLSDGTIKKILEYHAHLKRMPVNHFIVRVTRWVFTR